MLPRQEVTLWLKLMLMNMVNGGGKMEIKSNFVKGQLKVTKWKDRSYIYDLIKIEKFALGREFGMATPYLRARLMHSYPIQWKAIWLELNPQRYKKNAEYKKKEREREKIEAARFRREEALELKRERKGWREGGGWWRGAGSWRGSNWSRAR